MNNIPVNTVLTLLSQWREQEQEYKSEGLMSEASVLMMTRIELEEVLKSHDVEVPTPHESELIEIDLRESLMQVTPIQIVM